MVTDSSNYSSASLRGAAETDAARAGATFDQSQQSRGEALSGYQDLAQTGGLTQEQLDRVRSAGSSQLGQAENLFREFAASGGIDANAARVAHGTWSEIMNSGGWSQAAKAGVEGDVSGLREIGKYGAATAEGAARLRGGGVYDEFAQTGGLSEKDIQTIRSRSTSPIASYYSGMREDIERQSRMGNTGAGSAALMAKLGRDRARQVADTALSAEAGIAEAIRSGRQWGAQGMTSSEQLITGNQMTGLQAASNIQSGMQQALTSNRMAAGGALDASERSIQAMIQQGKMFGGEGLEAVGRQERAMEEYLLGLHESNQAAGLAGISDIAARDAQLAQGYQGMAQDAIAQNAGIQQSGAQILHANNPSGWDRVAQVAGIAAPVAASIFAPGGGMFGMGGNTSVSGGISLSDDLWRRNQSMYMGF